MIPSVRPSRVRVMLQIAARAASIRGDFVLGLAPPFEPEPAPVRRARLPGADEHGAVSAVRKQAGLHSPLTLGAGKIASSHRHHLFVVAAACLPGPAQSTPQGAHRAVFASTWRTMPLRHAPRPSEECLTNLERPIL